MMVFEGQSYTAEQMLGRSQALKAAAEFLQQTRPQHMSEANAVAEDLGKEADEWVERAKRCSDALSPGQRRTSEQLQAYLAQHGRSPTIVELADIDNVSATAPQLACWPVPPGLAHPGRAVVWCGLHSPARRGREPLQ